MKMLSVRDIFKKEFIFALLILLVTPWTWKIISRNLSLALLLILATFILIKLLSVKKLHAVYTILFCIVFFITSLISIHLGFDQSFRKLNFNEEARLNDRFGYYSKELGKLFLNRYTLNLYKNYNPDINKFQKNFFSGLDLNLYFFASHPRERAGVYEYEKFPSVFFIFFIIGAVYSLQLQPLRAMLYLLTAALINGLISPAFELGPFLFFPFIITLITFGVVRSLVFLRYLVRKVHQL